MGTTAEVRGHFQTLRDVNIWTIFKPSCWWSSAANPRTRPSTAQEEKWSLCGCFKCHLEIWNEIAQPVVRLLFRLKRMTWGHDVLAVHMLAGCTLKTKPLTNQDQQRYKILDLCFPAWLYLQSGRKNENIWVNFISCCFLNVIDYKCVLVMVVFLQMFLPLYSAVLKQLILHMLHHKCCRVFAVQPRTNSASTQIHSSMRSTLRVFLF